MTNEELLNELAGIGMPLDEMLASFSGFERCELQRLMRKCNFTNANPTYVEIVQALYRFKKVLNHYASLWWEDDLRRREYYNIFSPIRLHMEHPNKRCFAHNQFFGEIHYLLYACKKHSVPQSKRDKYLKMVCDFPVVPSQSFKGVVESEIWQANLPHTFMDMAVGKIRVELDRGRSHRKILNLFKIFLSELNIGKSHAMWFSRRLPGSAGSRQ